MNLTIRSARPEDYEDYLRLCEFVDLIHRTRLPSTFRRPDGPSRGKEYFLRTVNDPNQLLYFAELNGKSVGLLSGRIKQAPDTPIHVPKTSLMIENIVVDEANRKSGVGRKLHDFAVSNAQATGATEVNLILYSFNEGALSFYKKLGYSVECHWMSLPIRE
jgi:diamine N-acetyltransferase